MTIAEREQQILRVKSQSFQSELASELEAALRTEVALVIKATIEAALVEELEGFRASRSGSQPRRSGYFPRLLDTQYGRIPDLRVPKLRSNNQERQWQILQRYQRGIRSLLDFTLCLYVMGLSLRDLQEALYYLLGSVRYEKCHQSGDLGGPRADESSTSVEDSPDSADSNCGWSLGRYPIHPRSVES